MSTGTDIPLALATLDRAGHRRKDEAWLKAAFASDDARVMLMQNGMPLVEGAAPASGGGSVGTHFGGSRPLLWLGPQAAMLSDKARRLFLGMTAKGSPVFALDLPQSFSLASSPIAGLGVFEDFRAAASAMDNAEASPAATARSIFEWHRRNGFCANCGTATVIVEAGWKRVCEDCDAEHFPRVDPVAIMLAVRGDNCLLGRQGGWRPGFWSCLAGFVEPGETIEQAAARELEEEAGIRADAASARYLFGQPWPYAHSLMTGLILEAASEEITVDTNELETARWFTRDETTAMMDGRHPEFFAPPKLAIAHHVIRAWLDGR